MNLVPFTIYDPATGDILRTGHCRPMDLNLQAKAGEAMIESAADYIRDRVVIPSGSAPYLRRRSASSIAERLARFRPSPPPSTAEVILEALKAKGIAITEAELTAARSRLTGQA
jgi:hypothetical protein